MNKIISIISISIYCILLLTGCNKHTVKNDNTIKVEISSARPMVLSELIESIIPIPLETVDESLVKYITQLKIHNGKFYINNHRRNVLVFDENGKYLWNTASRIGQGPEDYYYAFSIDIADDGLLSIYEGVSSRVREYDSSLRLKASYNLNAPDSTRSALEMRMHVKIDKDLYLLRDPGYTYYYSVLQDSVFLSKHEYYEGDKCPLIANDFRFLKNERNIYFSPNYICDTLYQVNVEKQIMEPIVIYDLGNRKLDVNKFPNDMPTDYYKDLIQNTDKIILSDKLHFSFGDYAFANCFATQESYLIHHNKNGVTTVYKNGKERLLAPQAVYEDKLIYAVWPDVAQKIIKSPSIKDLMGKESMKVIENLKEDDNPILLCYKLKK